MKRLFNLFLISTLFFSLNQVIAQEVYQETEKHELYSEEEQERIVDWARNHLPQTGVLTEGRRGFVYLKVNDDYINQLFPMLPHRHGYTRPPYFRRPDSPGAHISVFYVNERDRTGEISEIGQKFSFKITDLASVPKKSHKYIVLKVESPELEKLREKYNLSPLLQGHQFHITIAKKKRRWGDQ